MEWNARWDWEIPGMFSSKTVFNPNKMQEIDWEIEEVGDIDGGSFNVSVAGGSGNSASEVVNNNSPEKSSLSVSAESSVKEGTKQSNHTFDSPSGLFQGYCKMMEKTGGDGNGTPPSLEASIGSGDLSVGLKLGKRTYFGSSCARSDNKTSSFSGNPESSASTTKKVKPSCPNTAIQCCQVEGCNLDLSSAKEYHKKHRVCENHSKSPKVVVGGLERRFCQQCSRFHGLSEFDENKRSCRRRLSDHNARRRKPHQETIHFNSTSLSSSLYDGRHQLSFGSNNASLLQPGSTVYSTWGSMDSSSYSQANKSEKVGKFSLQYDAPAIQFPLAVSMANISFSKPLASKDTKVGVFNQDFKDSMSSNVDEALDLRRALSLLSNSSWGSREPDFTSLRHSMQGNHTSMSEQAIPQVLPSLDYLQMSGPVDTQMQAFITRASNGSSHFQEFQIFKAPCETRLYANMHN